MPLRRAIDVLLDQVDWRCASCGLSTRVGCHCFDRTTPAQHQAIADPVRAQFRVLLKWTLEQLLDRDFWPEEVSLTSC